MGIKKALTNYKSRLLNKAEITPLTSLLLDMYSLFRGFILIHLSLDRYKLNASCLGQPILTIIHFNRYSSSTLPCGQLNNREIVSSDFRSTGAPCGLTLSLYISQELCVLLNNRVVTFAFFEKE